MNKFFLIFLAVLILPGLAMIVAVVVRLAIKGPRPSSRDTPSAKEEEPPPPTVT